MVPSQRGASSVDTQHPVRPAARAVGPVPAAEPVPACAHQRGLAAAQR